MTPRAGELSIGEIERARERLRGAIDVTPCAYSRVLSEMSGTRCHVKLENLQRTGSFKERGAANRLGQLDAHERRRGGVAASAGNHGLAVAFHAARPGVPAVIVMPEWAPLIKVTSARRHGAEVNIVHIEHDRAFSRWAAIAETEVELTLETTGREHVEDLKRRIEAAGYRVTERRV